MAKKYWWEDDEQQDKTQQKNGQRYWWDDDSTAADTVGTNITNRVNTWLKNHNTYISNYNKRYSGRKYGSEDAYVSDSSDWLDTVTKQKSAFDAEADAIISYMDQHKGYLDADWMDEVRKTLTEARDAQSQILDITAKDNEYWSQWSSEDLVNQYGSAEEAYKYYQRTDGYNKKYAGATGDEIQKAIETLGPGEEHDWLRAYRGDVYGNTIRANADFQDYATIGSGLSYTDFGTQTMRRGTSRRQRSTTTIDKYRAASLALAEHYGNEAPLGMYDKYDSQVAIFRTMEDEEFENLAYCIAYDKEHGTNTAEQYVDLMEETLSYRRGNQIGQKITGIDIPVVEGLVALGYGALAGIDSAAFGIEQRLSDDGKEVAYYPSYYANAHIGEQASGFDSYLHSAATNIGNMAPSILVSSVLTALGTPPKISEAVGSAVMGFSASGNAYKEALMQGYDKNTARVYGDLIGASEGIMQYLIGGISKLGGMSSKMAGKISAIDNALLRGAAKYGLSIGSEIVEEELQNFLEPAFRAILFGEDYDAPTIGEIIETAIVTALSTGFLEGGATYNGIKQDIALDKQFSNEYGAFTGDLIQEGLLSDPSSESYQLAQKFQKQTEAGKAMTGRQIRQQVQANEAQFAVEDYNSAVSTAKEKLRELGETKDIGNISKLVAKKATGQELTRVEKSTLARSDYGAKVAKEMTTPTTQAESGAKAYNVTYKSITERVGENARYDVSESGQTTIRNEEGAVTIAEVSKIEDGQLTVKLDDGREVYAGDIEFANDTEARLYSAVADMENITPAAATALVKNFDTTGEQSVTDYVNGIDEAYTYGYYGYSEADLKAGNFTSNLTSEQMMSAYRLGQSAKKIGIESKSENIVKMRTAAEAEAQKTAEAGKEAPKAKNMTITYNEGNGKVVDFDKAGVKLTSKQKAAPVLARVMHDMGLGTNFELFSSYLSKTLKDENGNPVRVFLNDQGVEEIAYSGVYRKSDGTIRIDLNAYNGRQLTLNAMAHELTHFIQQWSTEKYEALADFLVKTYEKTDMTMHERVLREQARLERIRKEDVSYDEAYDEVVANAMSKMLDDGKVMEKLTELQAKDASLAKKLWEGLKKLLNKFFRIYSQESALFHDAADLMDLKAEFEQMQQMWAEAFVEASENFQANLLAQEVGVDPVAVEDVSQYSYSSLAEAAGFVAVENEDGTRSFTRDGNKVSKVTIEDIENSPIGAFINFSLEMKDISKADADRQKKMFADICTMACKTNDFAMTMQFVGSAVFTGMKANADKQYGTTYDFPSICTKTQAVIDAMSAKMMSLGRGLNSNEIVQLYADVFASGNPVPCPECYVFSRWIGIGGLLDNIKKYQDYYGDMAVEDVADAYRKMKAEVSKFADEQGISFGKAKGALTSKLTKEFNKLTEKIEKAQNQGEKIKASDRQRLAELEPMMNTVKSMTWLENVYFADSSLKKVNPNFRVPNEVLFDLNNGEAFASQYKEAWAFRTTQGAGYGKAITPYAEARLGEGVLVTNNTTNAIKGRAQGSLNNYFLNQKGKLDKQSRDALKKARMKQKIQAFIGGQRFQSTSDARYENASDYLLAALEMQAMHGMVQAYTKVDGAVPAFSAWGFSINQSLMPLNGGLDADGNVKDTAVGGMKPSVAFENRQKHETAGTITIGVNDNHIRAMFKQVVRDFIIPYHASGGKADVVAEFRRIQEGKEAKGKAVRSTDYSRTQSDKVLSDEVLRWQGKTDAQIQRIHEIRNARIAILTGGNVSMTVVRSNRFLSALYDKLNGGEWDGVKLAKSKVESQIFPNEFWDQTVTYDDSAKITKDYLEYCEDLGFLHRFSGMIPSNGKLVPANGYNENGERVQLTDLAYKYDENGNKTTEVEEFFWKVLTDRRMYDNNGNYLPQKIVTLNDTTTETVTGFAKNNQGRQYDKAKAEALAKKIAGEQYSSQETDADAKEHPYSYSTLVSKPDMPITTVDGNVPNNRADVVYQAKQNAAKVGKIDSKTGSVSVHVDDIGADVTLGTDGLKHGLRRTKDAQNDANYIVTLKAGEIIKHSIKVNEMTPKKADAKEALVLIGVARNINGYTYVVRSIVNRFSNALTSIDVLYAINAKKEELAATKSPRFTAKPLSVTSSTISIEELLDLVNQYFPDVLPESVLKHYGHDARPDGDIGSSMLYSSQETDLDVGYHAGDLGKAESLRQQGLGRDTGHFGTGTYFVGNKASIEGYNSRNGNPAPVETVDFNKYNLFKPKSASEGYLLHDFLRGVDGYWNRDVNAVNTMEEYESLQEKLSELVYDIESEEFGETNPSKESWLAVEREFLSDAKRMMGDYSVCNKLTDTLTQLTDVGYYYDSRNGEYYSYDINAKQFTYYAEDEIVQKLNAEEGGWKAFEGIEKMADERYSYSRTSRYESWTDSIKDVAKVLGISEQKVRNVFQRVTEDINSRGYTDEDMETADSAATRFMKALGYEGIDVRGIKGLDNTSYGSVIYDLKGEDLARKKAIGTARYSTQETDNISNRDLLSNAFEGIVQNSIEYEMLQDYKDRIKELNKLESKLSDINREIRKIRFTEGEYDAKKLRELEEEAKKAAQEINRHDWKLLNLEASEPLRRVIDRERKKEAKKTRDHVKEIQQNKKDRAEKAELRQKIRKKVRDLNKLLNRGNKKLNVKEDMKGFVSKALELADYLFTDHVSNDELIRKGITVRMTPKEAALVKEIEDILSKIYDHADSLTDEEFTRLDAKRKANEDKLRDLLTAQRNERLQTPVYNLFSDLVTEYSAFKNSKQDAVKAAYNPEVERFLRTYVGDEDSDRAKTLKNMRVADMTTEELWKLDNAYQMVLHAVRTANKLFVKGNTESIEQMVTEIVMDFGSRKIPEKKMAIAMQKLGNKIGWDYEKLYYALDRIGSKAFTDLIMNLANSENIVMQDIIEAAEFRDEIVEKYGFNNWDVNKEIDREFLDHTGKKFKLTLGQLMSLYAYSRREGAWDHIEYGGFVFGEAALTNPKPADSFKLSKEQCEAITNTLTKEQKSYVEDMQKFLSETMGNKGNEVSMMLYGIKMFGEKNYFPIHIAGQFKAQAQESQAKQAAGFGSMSNAGFTHAQNPQAKAPFVLEGFNEVWSDHVNEMSRYHGTVPALEDLRRVMNRSSYSENTAESTSVKVIMENHFGKEAVEYFDNLYREANSGAITDKLQQKSKKLLSLFRKNSVAYSLSVLVQQPASLVRAYAMIDRKYFGFKGVGAITSGVYKAVSSKWNKAYENAYNEMLKYAPGVTMTKEIGGFDTSTGGSIRSYLLDTDKSFKQKWKTGTAKEKGQAVMDLVDDNPIANLPNVADKIAWIEIWNACKRETLATHKDLAPTSDEFMNIVGERFTEVIRATQVYDSIFAKSPMLKSKNLAVQMLVSFMNEPNTVANMAESAVRDFTKGNRMEGLKKVHVLVHSIIFTGVLKSLIYAMRDDDEDETYIEKYIEALAGSLMDDFNAFNYIPFARDVWSVAQGYDVERADMAIVADAIGALNKVIKAASTDRDGMTEDELIELDKKVTEASWNLVESLAAVVGIPMKNIRREINAVIDHAKIASANAGKTTAMSAWDTISEAVIDSIPFMGGKSKTDKLYAAIIEGDTEYIERMKATYKTEDAYHTAVRKALRENDPRIKEAAQAHINGDPSKRVSIAKQIIADGFSLDDVVTAINSEINAMTASDSESGAKKEKGVYTAADIAIEAANGDWASVSAIKDDIIQTAQKNGKTKDEAESDFESSVQSKAKEAYLEGTLNDAAAEKLLVEYAGMGEDEAAETVRYWSFKLDYPEYDLSQSVVTKYYEYAEPMGIGVGVYHDFYRFYEVSGEAGVKDSKVIDCMEYIDSLNLNKYQKDAIALSMWAESTVNKYKLW